jgi:hypothetical protein
MKLALVSFLAALAAAPLAAQAAPSGTRYAVSLQATVAEQTTYTQSGSDGEDCTFTKTGSDGRRLLVHAVRPARVAAIRGTVRVAVTGARVRGSWSQLRKCRFSPPERLNGKCAPSRINRIVANVSFRRSAPNRIAVGPAGPRLSSLPLCGLAEPVQAGAWIDLAVGSVAERQLRAGKARVLATGTAERERTLSPATDPTLKLTQKLTIAWRLVFRRL